MITNGINEQYHGDKAQLTAARVGRLLRELGIKTKRYKKGYRVKVKESKEAWGLVQRQYPAEEEETLSSPKTGGAPIEGDIDCAKCPLAGQARVEGRGRLL